MAIQSKINQALAIGAAGVFGLNQQLNQSNPLYLADLKENQALNQAQREGAQEEIKNAQEKIEDIKDNNLLTVGERVDSIADLKENTIKPAEEYTALVNSKLEMINRVQRQFQASRSIAGNLRARRGFRHLPELDPGAEGYNPKEGK